MRAIWKGAISFGMVSIPVKLYTATEQKDVRFKLLHRDDGAPIVEKRFCTAEDREVAWDDLVRGYEVSKGEYVILDPAEIEAAKPESATTIDIGDFVELTEVDPIYFEKSYFLEPTDVGAKAFTLLRRALEETGRVAVAKVTIRSKERLATVRAYDGTLLLETMFWPDEIRSTGGLDLPDGEETRVRPKELDMARSLVESLSDRFKPDEYTDRYRIALQELIERKMKGEARSAKRRKPEPKVVDLMEALEASLRASRGGNGNEDEAPSPRGRRKAGQRAGKRDASEGRARRGRSAA
ncbi:MAG TPA: Ku protein [Candidatus Limnocylindria bacterium]|nr:Ku protein [Candidatus Limnocylindria bacterium]